MVSVLESYDLVERCAELELQVRMVDRGDPETDVYITDPGGSTSLQDGASVPAYRLSDLLLKMYVD